MGDRPHPVTFTFDERHPLEATPRDTIASALLSAGVAATSRSAKYRRPRGPFCLEGDCGTCLVRVNGVPNVRACMTEVQPGMHVSSQNLLGPDHMDPSRIVDRFLGTMDHHHFAVKPKIANTVMQAVVRNLTGLGILPDHPRRAPPKRRHLTPTVLVVGAGAAGQAAHTRLRDAGVDVLTLDRTPGADAIPGLHRATAVFACYPAEHIWTAAHRHRDGDSLWTICPQHVVLATGARASMVPLQNNDLPGVLSARGLLRQSERTGRDTPACVVVGDGPHAVEAARALGAQRIATDEVVRIEGHNRVEAVKIRSGRIRCSVVALAGPLAPAHDLPVQAGATVEFDGTGFATKRDDHGAVSTASSWRTWACGDVAGHMGPAAAEKDGQRVADSVIVSLHGDARV